MNTYKFLSNCTPEEFNSWFQKGIENIKKDIPSFLDFLVNFSDMYYLAPVLIYLQDPKATKVFDKYSWEYIYGRKVKKGAKPLLFISTINENKVTKGKSIAYYYIGYDISQTEGAPYRPYISLDNNRINYIYSKDDFMDSCIMYVVQKILSNEINLKYDSIPIDSICFNNRFSDVLIIMQDNIRKTLLNNSDFELEENTLLKNIIKYTNPEKEQLDKIISDITFSNHESIRKGFDMSFKLIDFK